MQVAMGWSWIWVEWKSPENTTAGGGGFHLQDAMLNLRIVHDTCHMESRSKDYGIEMLCSRCVAKVAGIRVQKCLLRRREGRERGSRSSFLSRRVSPHPLWRPLSHRAISIATSFLHFNINSPLCHLCICEQFSSIDPLCRHDEKTRTCKTATACSSHRHPYCAHSNAKYRDCASHVVQLCKYTIVHMLEKILTNLLPCRSACCSMRGTSSTTTCLRA